ncbi:hypothetical protein COOONC_16225 [Cooperia oncophora]
MEGTGCKYSEPVADLLWTSPENLRSGNFAGSQEGDVYSFAIISSQLVTKAKAWDLNHRKEDAEVQQWLHGLGSQSADTSLEKDSAETISEVMRVAER